MARVKALFYGINGTGLGHISRLLNMAREARELLRAMNVRADFHFITTSEAPQTAWDFPVYKLPSKTVVAGLDTANGEFAANCQFFITNLVATLRPDILVMDTMPQGSFGEFLSLRAFCKKKVFINRHKKAEQARSEIHLNHLPLYDLILTPDPPQAEERYVIPPEVRDRCVFTDVVHGYREEEALTREEVRRLFGVRDDQKVIYISAGGGGDKQAESELSSIVAAASDSPTTDSPTKDSPTKDSTASPASPKNFVLVGYGPLYRGEKLYRPNVVPLTEPDVRRFFRGIDLAISAGGYNTYQELLAAGIPTAFYSQTKGMDSQDERIRLGVEQGWNLELQNVEPISVQEAIEALLNKEFRAQLRAKLEQRGTSHGALASAVEILRLHGSLKGSPVNTGTLYLLAQLRKAWPPFALRNQIFPDDSRNTYIETCRHMLDWRSIGDQSTEQSRLLEKALVEWRTHTLSANYDALLELGFKLNTIRSQVDVTGGKFRSLLKKYISSRNETRAMEVKSPSFEQLSRFCQEQINDSTTTEG